MADGVVAELKELIDLRRYACLNNAQPEGKALRSGGHLSPFRGRGMDFSEVRNYQAGDEIRHMEWRVTARTGRPHVKIYQEERERPLVILVDFNPSMLFGTRVAFKSVIAARLAALIAWVAMKQGDKVGGLFFSATEHSEFTPKGRDAGVLSLLASLSRYTAQSIAQREAEPQKLSAALTRLQRVVRPGSTIVLISDFYTLDADCEKYIRRLRSNNNMLAYHVCDPIELAPPTPQQYALSNGQRSLILDTSRAAVRQAYADYCQQRVENIRQQCQRMQIQCIHTPSDTDLPQLVRYTFPGRSRG